MLCAIANKCCANRLLRNLSILSPVLNNETRRSSNYHMIDRFNDIREALIEAADSDDSELVIDRRVSFKNKTVKYAKQLGEINIYQIADGHWTS